MKKLWTVIKDLLIDPRLIESVRLREEWYRNEIIQALDNGDFERAIILEGEKNRCYGLVC